MKHSIITIALLLISIIGNGQNSKFTKLDSFFMKLEDSNRFLGSIAVSQHGKIIYNKAIGYANIATNVSNTSETKFRIGSITKTFTAVLIMKAVEMGKIDLDDTIEKYFPEIQNAKAITVRHLLNHRSGIHNFTNDEDYLSWYTKPITKADFIDKIVHKGIDFEPDAKHDYSNSNYILLTFILENIFGKSYPQILEQYIIEPLNLTNTSYGGAINPEQNEAQSYQMNIEWDIEPETHISVPLGAGGVVSTPTDLCHFAEALFSGKLVSAKSLEQMKPVGDDSYGFALFDLPFDEKKGLGHTGRIDAFSSTLTYFEADKLCFALSSNGHYYSKKDIAKAVLSEVFDRPYKIPTFENIELTSEDLDQYLGTYETDKLPLDITISKQGNTLISQATGQSSFPLAPEGSHMFTRKRSGIKITFIPDEQKFILEQGGGKFEFLLKKSVESIELTSQDLDQYLGTYETDKLPMDLIISKQGNKLIGQGTGQPSFPLAAEGSDVFSNKDIGLKITFFPDEQKMSFEQGSTAFEMTLKESVKSIELTSEELDQYLGTYETDKLPMDLIISKQGNKLIGQGTGQPSFPLAAEGSDVFSNKDIGLKITFFPDEQKMQFEQGSATFVMTRAK